MLRILGVAAVSVFIMGASPVATYNDCFHGCVLNCMKFGMSAQACSDICQDQACEFAG
jgi:hypothetical protein